MLRREMSAKLQARRKSTEPTRIAAAFKSAALEAAGRLLDTAFDRADEGLAAVTADAGYDPDLFKACDEAARLARDERAKLTLVFIQVLGEGLSGHGALGEPGDEALLPAEEADEVVRASQMAGRLVDICADELESLEGRLATLADYADISPTAVSPTALCQSFRQAMQAVSGRPEAKHLLYALFERGLERRLGRLYQRLDAGLAKRGVAPKPRDQTTETVRARPPQSAHWARQLLAARRSVAPENEFGTGEILTALASLGGREEVWRSPRNLIKALLAHLRRRQRDTAPRALPVRARRQLGLATAWWCDLNGDPAVPAPAKPMLERLRPTLLEIALLDEGLFREPDNPARRLVNELITLAEPGETGVWRRADAVVDRVVGDFEKRPGVVTAAAKALARRRRATRAAAVAKARRMAALELRQQALGRPPPAGIQAFLLKGWAPLLTRAYLEGGVATATWHTAVIRLSQLLDLAQPPGYGSDREARVRDQRGLMRKIRAQLLDRGVTRGRIVEFMDAVGESFAEANRAEPRAAPEIETFDDPVAWDADLTVFSDSDEDESDDDLPEAAEAARAEEAMPADTTDTVVREACKAGRWFQLHAGEEGGSRWLRVGGYDPARGMVSFVNRRGDIVYERAAGAFAEDLRTGRSRPIYDAETFEARLASIIGEHARSLGDD